MSILNICVWFYCTHSFIWPLQFRRLSNAVVGEGVICSAVSPQNGFDSNFLSGWNENLTKTKKGSFRKYAFNPQPRVFLPFKSGANTTRQHSPAVFLSDPHSTDLQLRKILGILRSIPLSCLHLRIFWGIYLFFCLTLLPLRVVCSIHDQSLN